MKKVELTRRDISQLELEGYRWEIPCQCLASVSCLRVILCHLTSPWIFVPMHVLIRKNLLFATVCLVSSCQFDFWTDNVLFACNLPKRFFNFCCLIIKKGESSLQYGSQQLAPIIPTIYNLQKKQRLPIKSSCRIIVEIKLHSPTQNTQIMKANYYKFTSFRTAKILKINPCSVVISQYD